MVIGLRFFSFPPRSIYHFIARAQILAADDAVEVVKAISAEKKLPMDIEKESDQVALESQDNESAPAILIPHAPPPSK